MGLGVGGEVRRLVSLTDTSSPSMERFYTPENLKYLFVVFLFLENSEKLEKHSWKS